LGVAYNQGGIFVTFQQTPDFIPQASFDTSRNLSSGQGMPANFLLPLNEGGVVKVGDGLLGGIF